MVIYTGAIQAFDYFKDDEGRLNLVFTHRYGIKLSRIIRGAYSRAIESLFGYHITSTILPSSIVIEIMEKDAANIVGF